MTQVPETMPAAVFMGLRDVAVEDRPTPKPGPGELLLEVSHCGICGSDLHFLLEWGGRAGVIEGHEYSGTVAALGPDVAGWAVGERAIGGPSPRCGRCEYCLAHRTSLCVERGGLGGDDGTWQGAFARYKTVRAAEALRVPEGLSLKHAALTEPLAVALHGITRAGGARPGTRWLVTGGGPIGFLSVAALKALGVDDIVVSEPKASRRSLCEKLGARAVDPTELVMPAMPYDMVDEPFDVALECSGNGRAQESALAQLKRAGTLVLVGAGMARPKFDPNRILLNELVITGAFVYDHDGFPRALELLASGRLANDLLVEQEDYPLNRLLDAAVGLHEGDLAAKAMIVPRTS
ncbi:MAG: (R,R)-butanediol dehydrogenase / meso-butanediol dehydrogenase / diacetyl reductase [Actinomycetota bacterium]|jgi:(R,R)-butanediol dehydrogenase/meso-butanediol dehydrogenase/diacetyl reductase|nr:(R,R)-butanediol dehydrogenase / meso-butanediol dehydrogenase / diacetyl reductase [Actinomycetota bacterium]